MVGNDGAEPALSTYLYVALDGDWVVSDWTTLGVVSLVDGAAVIPWRDWTRIRWWQSPCVGGSNRERKVVLRDHCLR